jgi:hypothetical protein
MHGTDGHGLLTSAVVAIAEYAGVVGRYVKPSCRVSYAFNRFLYPQIYKKTQIRAKKDLFF